MKTIRCAIYTRKSNEEGLDQAFNSLDAQRQAGIDYIKSQKHEGWTALPDCYDDGGFSGGTMKRPALERLLTDIRKGSIDVVVVYKVDRLSRSLGDFARMMDLFDQHGVSFVSVTQQFNTTTSMGRLTLNMLLSFAQFEREVAGERIRDKIAATKKQGYWVCGQPPLGYRIQTEDEPRGLYIIEDEAELVRMIFERFLKLQSLVEVAEALNAEGHTTKRWLSSRDRWHGGKSLTQKYIYRILTNPVYIGRVTHKRNGTMETHKGRHEPIVEKAIFDRVQQLFERQDRATRHRWNHPHLLKGKIRTHEGFALSPSSVHRPLTKKVKTCQKRIVSYYVSQKAIRHGFKSCPIKTINASHLDDLVRGLVLDNLDFGALDAQPADVRDHWIREAIDGIELAPDRLTVRLWQEKIECLKTQRFEEAAEDSSARPTCPYKPEVRDEGRLVHLTLRIQIKRLDGKRMLLSPAGDDLVLSTEPQPKPHIVDAIGRAYRWQKGLSETGLSIRDYAEKTGASRSRMLKLLPLTFLGPEVLRHALRGTLSPSITLDDLLAAACDLDWDRQAKSLGLDRLPAVRAAG